MAEPLPKDNRCSRCGEWFHNAHACGLTGITAFLRPCLYVNMVKGTICRKCGQFHDDPIFPPHPTGQEANNG